MTFVKAVISSSYTPVGFVYETNGMECFEDFNKLCRRGASDGRLTFSESGVFGLYKYAENDVKVCRETEGGGYSDPIDPGITLTQRIVSGGKVVGYVVKDGTGAEVKKRIDSILSAAKYLKPVNFKVVTRDGHRFIQGMAGTVLSELPCIDLTPAINTPMKPKTVRAEPHDVVDPKLAGGVSLIRLFEIVDECGGSILKMPSDEYNPVGETRVEDAIGFTRIKKACEVAPSVLTASSKKLSASLKYKVPGAVMLSDGSAAISYIFRDKNLINVHYENGVIRGDKVRLDRIGIAVPQANAPRLYQALVGTVAVSPMQDKVAADSAIKLAKIPNPELLEVNVGELPILGAQYADYLLAGVQIKDILTNISKYKYAFNFLKVLCKGLRGIGVASAPTVWGHYAKLSQTVVDELGKYVDISTGTYKETGGARSNPNAVAKEANVEIVYGLSEDIEAPKDENVVAGMSLSDVPYNVQELLAPILAETDDEKRLMLAEAGKKQCSATAKQFELLLFKHKIAMLLDGSNAVHSHDAFEWHSAPVSARAQFTKYTHDCGIYVTLRQISMKQ